MDSNRPVLVRAMLKKLQLTQEVRLSTSTFFLFPVLALLLAACSASPVKPEPEMAVTGTAGAADASSTTSAPLIPVLNPQPFNMPITPPPEHLWARLRPSFELPACDAVPRATAWAHWYAGKEDYLNRVLERAEPVLYFIVEEIEARGMPGEIALLPVVESAFKPFAMSSASAAGLWQFIPATGERYGLKQTWWYDGRRDIYAATHAAMDYLTFLADMFNGDWLLALASYNSGENRVMRLVERQMARGEPATFWAIDEHLPRETREYVPQLLGVACLVREPARFNVALHPILNKPRFAAVEVNGQIDLALAAKLAGMDVQDLYLLNPAFNRWATAPEGPHRLLLPVDRVAPFKRNLAAIPPEARVRWARVQVQRGDTLSEIARHYGISVNALQRVNNMQGSLIRAGSKLLVPRPAAGDDPELLALARRLSAFQQELGLHSPRNINVKRGDTLWGIAHRYDVSVSQLARLNGIRAGDILHIGQQLRLPGSGGLLANNSSSRPSHYTVRRGDSLWEIARRFSISLDNLMRWNGVGADTLLHPGQSLRLFQD